MLRFLTAGESHGPTLTAILDGFPAGFPLDPSKIDRDLARRQKGYGSGGRMKIEMDKVQILSGVMAGKTTGAPIAMLVKNIDHAKWKGGNIAPLTKPRPGHADLTGVVKYGYCDLRPALERSSARETTMRVAIGAVCKIFLAQFGITVGGYVKSIGEVECEPDNRSFLELFQAADESIVRCPDPIASEKMCTAIEQTIQNKDTLGGIIEIDTIGLPIGLGSYAQWDRRLEAKLAQAILSVQAIKGMEIGDAFENTRLPGTKAHDPIRLEGLDFYRTTNKAGGTEGGISNGQMLIIRAAMKPIASTLTPQSTVDLATGLESLTHYERSDFCPVPRAVPILEAMVAFVLADALIEKLGGDSLEEMLPRFSTLRKANLTDLPMDNKPHIWWE
jgi:chorismate synthase